MNEEIKQLLDEVIENRLRETRVPMPNDEADSTVFKQAMDAIDRQIELAKIDAANEEQLKKQELAEKEVKINRLIRCVELGLVTLAVPVIQYCCNMRYAKVMCNFEKDYTFTTSAGRSLSRLFQFKK